MARGVADLLTRMLMDSSQAQGEAGKFQSKIGGIKGVAHDALRAGLGADLLEVTRGLGDAADRADFLKDRVSAASVSLGMLGPAGLAAGGLIQAGLALGGDGLDSTFDQMEETARTRSAEISALTVEELSGIPEMLRSHLDPIAAKDLFDPAFTTDLQDIQSQVAQALGFGGDKAAILGGLAASIRANEGDVSAATAEVVQGILGEADFSNDMTALANAGMDSLVEALSSGSSHADAVAAADLLASDMATAMDLEAKLDAALALVKPVLGANSRGEVISNWAQLGADSARAWNQAFAASWHAPFGGIAEGLRTDAARRGVNVLAPE